MKKSIKSKISKSKLREKAKSKGKRKFKFQKSFSFRLRNLNIGVKYLLALFVVIILFLSSALTTVRLLISIQKDIFTLEEKGRQALMVTKLGSIFREKDIIISDYLKSKDEGLIEEYDNKSKEFSEILNGMEKYMDTPELQDVFANIQSRDNAINSIFMNEVVPYSKKSYESIIDYVRNRVSTIREDTIVFLDQIRDHQMKQREIAVNNASANIKRTIYLLGVFFVLSTVLGIITVLIISRSVSRNLNKVVNISNKITEGDLAVEKITYEGKDEIGKLARSINEMVDSLRNMVMETSYASKNLKSQSDELDAVAKEVLQGSNEITGTMQEMAADIEEQAGTSNNIANIVNEFSKLIEKSNLEGKKLNESSQVVLRMADEGNRQMEESVDQMNIINKIIKDSVEKIKELEINIGNITKLINVINDISQQTNLLALNASIEAARAGEAGRGFAVVAEEIRKLAEQVGKSVTEITEIVKDIQKESNIVTEALKIGYQEVEQGTNQVKNTGEFFAKINNEVNNIGKMIEELTTNLEKVAENSENINKSVEEAASISERNAGGVEEISALVEQQNSSMENVKKNAELMEKLVEKLNNSIKKYKI